MVASAPRQRERPWLAACDRGVPATLEPYPRETLVDVVDRTTCARRDHPTVLFKGRDDVSRLKRDDQLVLLADRAQPIFRFFSGNARPDGLRMPYGHRGTRGRRQPGVHLVA